MSAPVLTRLFSSLNDEALFLRALGARREIGAEHNSIWVEENDKGSSRSLFVGSGFGSPLSALWRVR